MKKNLLSILKKLKLYHPLQTFYREAVASFEKLYYKALYNKHKGPGFICNFCGASYKKFVARYPAPNIAKALYTNNVIAGPGENVYCPNCLSKNRERLIKAFIEKNVDVKNKKVLHFSPEKNLYNFLKDISDVTTVDISPGFYKNIDKKILYADATKLRFAAESFDIIIANHILEHIPDDISAMKEIYRVLKIGGIAILQVPYSETLPNTIEDPGISNPSLQAELYGQEDHVRIYALDNYMERLGGAGFIVEVVPPEDLLQFRIHAIQERESVIVGWKWRQEANRASTSLILNTLQ